MSFWTGKRVLCTGAATGFLGKHLVEKLKSENCTILAPTHKGFDLRGPLQVEHMMRLYAPLDVVIHLAAKVGGIGANQAAPAEFFYDNMMMGLNVIHQAHLAHVGKLVFIGSTCSYPSYTPIPFDEDNLWNGYPEESNAPYGVAKRSLLTMLQAYREQHGLNGIYLIPANLFGPGDNFDPKTSHIIPAIIRKVDDALSSNAEQIVLWGTGEATRDFLYVEDAVEAILLATEKYDSPDPINLGSGFEVSIKSVVMMICSLMGYRGKIVCDTSKPNGQLRRRLDIRRARKYLGWTAKTRLEDGLRATIEWYRS